jgi:hypothetical protein
MEIVVDNNRKKMKVSCKEDINGDTKEIRNSEEVTKKGEN